MTSQFEDDVRRVVRTIRPGEVMSYGEVALEAGRPGAARAVGNVLSNSEGLPWWRVVTASGRLASQKQEEQGRLLMAEGHEVLDGHVRMR